MTTEGISNRRPLSRDASELRNALEKGLPYRRRVLGWAKVFHEPRQPLADNVYAVASEVSATPRLSPAYFARRARLQKSPWPAAKAAYRARGPSQRHDRRTPPNATATFAYDAQRLTAAGASQTSQRARRR